MFCGFTLDYRLVSKNFGTYVLKNIHTIVLKDDIDNKSFNLLCRWAINIQCRMKNVKNLELSNRYEFQELVQGKAKTLKFGNWK